MKQALQALIAEMEYVLSCINENKVPFDGDDFHEALRLGKEALSQTENDKERCVGCEACIDTACGRDECPKGWPKAAQPEQEPTCKQSLQVEQDPVAWTDGPHLVMRTDWRDRANYKGPWVDIGRAIPDSWVPVLYTTPPQRKPLTDDEAFELIEQDYQMEEYAQAALQLIRRAEAAHGIKE